MLSECLGDGARHVRLDMLLANSEGNYGGLPPSELLLSLRPSSRTRGDGSIRRAAPSNWENANRQVLLIVHRDNGLVTAGFPNEG